MLTRLLTGAALHAGDAIGWPRVISNTSVRDNFGSELHCIDWLYAFMLKKTYTGVNESRIGKLFM